MTKQAKHSQSLKVKSVLRKKETVSSRRGDAQNVIQAAKVPNAKEEKHKHPQLVLLGLLLFCNEHNSVVSSCLGKYAPLVSCQ